mgnify:CR=1 FL=1
MGKDIAVTVMIAAFVTTLASILLNLLIWDDRVGFARLFPDAEMQQFWMGVVWAIGLIAFIVAMALTISMGEETSQRSRS